MKVICLLVASLLAGLCLRAEPRTWTDRAGRTVEAEFVEVDLDHVKIRRVSDGRLFSLPIASMSDVDRAFLQELAADGDGDGAITPATPQSEAFTGLKWPRRVELPDDYDVTVIREDNDASEYIYRTPNFEFRSDVKLARKVVREFGKIFEGTYVAMQAFPLEWKPQPSDSHFVTKLFETESAYYDAGGMPNSGGVYRPSVREIYVPLTSLGVKKSSSGYTLDDSEDYLTLVHEITHQVHHDWLGRLPPWVIEGMAVYMESVPFERTVFRFDKRDLEDFIYERQRVRETFFFVRPEELMTMTAREWNANFYQDPEALGQYYLSAFLLLNYFLHYDGEGNGQRLWAYCRALESGSSESEAREILLDGRSYDELFESMQRAYNREDLELVTLGSN